MKNKLLLIALAGSLLFAGCTTGNNTPTDPGDDPGPVEPEPGGEDIPPEGGDKEEVVEIYTLKQALIYINKKKNYTFETNSAQYGKISYIFTENALGVTMSRKTSGLSAYIKDEQGIYPLNYESGYVAGEYILDESGNKVTDLYGGSIYPTLYGVETSYINSVSDTTNNVEITKKDYKMKLISTLGFTSTDYLSVNKIFATFVEGKLTFNIQMSNASYKFDLTNVGTSKIDDVDLFLESGGHSLELDGTLKKARELIKGDNFTRDIYSFDTEGYTGIEVFNPRYFYTAMNSATSGSGVIEANQKANATHSMDLYGCYMFQAEGDLNDINGCEVGMFAQPMFDRPDVAEYYHYPTYLKILGNMQFVKEGAYDTKGYTYQGSSYYFDNMTYVYDFVANFSIDQSFATDTYVPEAIGIDISLADNDSACKVTFIYYFTYVGTTYVMPIPLRDFGSSNYVALDYLYNMYND